MSSPDGSGTERPVQPGGSMLYFLHANGYPPEAYGSLIAQLGQEAEVAFPSMRPLWPGQNPRRLTSWHQLADDLVRELVNHNRRAVIGVGHSLGGVVALLAAARHPGLFRKLVLIEPVFLPEWWYALLSGMPVSWRHRMVPLARQALRRRTWWSDAATAFSHLRRKTVFRRIPDAVFREMMAAMVRPGETGGVALQYSRDWEARIYATVTNPWRALRQLPIPVLILRGLESDTLPDKIWARMEKALPTGFFREIGGAGHLLPFEKPGETVSAIRAFLKNS